MVFYKATLKLATPNEEGKKLDFTSAPILKEFREHVQNHNDKQQKQLRILSVTENTLDILMYSQNTYGDGRDFTALSNILRNAGWLKYSSTNNLLTTTNFEQTDVQNFEDIPLLPKEYNYIWTQDFNKLINNEQAIDLLKALFVLTNNEQEYLTTKVSKQKYDNCLYRVKEALFDAFN